MADIPQRTLSGQHTLLAFLFVLAVIVFLAGCENVREPAHIRGETMGTSYMVTLSRPPASLDVPALKSEIDGLLEALNDSMSTYRNDSEISLINRSEAEKWHDVSADFLAVLMAALKVSERSQGAFDVTVGPLVDLWGFGAEQTDQVPDVTSIEEVSTAIGYQALQLDEANSRLFLAEGRELDFSALAKGYGVDSVAELLVRRDIVDFLVEIGGEIRVSGSSPRGDLWRLAVERPELAGGAPMAALEFTDKAVATSGDYRNFFERDGVRYSHTIDPRTGWPVQHELVSVTVVSDSAMEADAWATALTVLGLEGGLSIASEEGLAVFLITRSAEGLKTHKTAAIDPYLQ